MDVGAWLRDLGLEQYEQVFVDNDIDAALLPRLTAEDLKELGVASIGHRRRLLDAISDLGFRSPAAEQPKPASAVPHEDPGERAPPEAERRQLTVLFCDLVGSTEMAARLDPEDMGRIIRAYQERCAATIDAWGGHIAKYMGDGVLAYFGYPRAEEDEAERAVRAALELVDRVRALETDQTVDLEARIGIATGRVVVGELIGHGAAQEQTVVGETPNLAARLQALAQPGSVVISPSTRNLLGALFDLADLGEHDLKGFKAPVRAWRVIGEGRAENRFEALRGRHPTSLVGREHELGLLLERWAWATEGDGQVVLLSGEPGIGKSRIVRALRERLAGGSYTPLSHYGSPYHQNTALHPVIGLLERAAGFGRDDAPDVRLQKLEQLLAPSSEHLEEVVPLLAALLTIPTGGRYRPLELSPRQQKQRMLEVLVDQVEGLARHRPVLVVYEDVQWMDPSTHELLDLLVERARRLPVLVVMTLRPDFQPPWTGQAHVASLMLNRLGRRHSTDMVERVTGGRSMPAEVLEQIVAKTDGVPLFVEELTKAVVESGLLKDAGDHLELRGSLPELAIPATLQNSLMARLDRLAPVKEIAQIGAVIGRSFSHELLAAVAGRPDDQLCTALDRLIASELVFRHGCPPEASYSFKHALVQDAAYQSLLKSKRQHLHAHIAQALEESFPHVIENEPEVLAHHHTQAGLVPRAISYWLSAGRKAATRSADQEAAAHLARGLELVAQLPDTPERAAQELDLRVALGPVLMNIRGSAAQEVAAGYERAHHLCREVGGPEQAFPVVWGLWFNRNMSGRLREAEELAQELIRVAEQMPETVFRLQGHHAAWTTRHALAELALALEHVEQGLALYDPDRHASSAFVYGGHDAGVCAYTAGAFIRWTLGYPDGALHLAREGVVLANRLRHPFSTAQALCYKAIVHQLRGEPGPVGDDADELLAHCTQHGLKIWSRNAQILKGWTLVAKGDFDEGLALIKPAIDERRTVGVKTRQAYYLVILAETLRAVGQPEEGIEAVTEALELITSTEDRRWEALARGVHGDLLLASSSPDQASAEAAFRCALETARRQGARSLELRAATSHGRLLAARGEQRQAHDLLAPLYGWFTEGFDTQDLKDAKTLLDELR